MILPPARSVARPVRTGLFWLLGALSFAGLVWVARHNYLLFHGLVEAYAIAIAFSIFVVAWNCRRFTDNGYFLFLGLGYACVGFLDLLHTLAYKGMGVFPGHGADLATQLWIAARAVESATLLLAPAWLRRRLRPDLAALGFLSVLALLLASLFLWRVFPACYVEGQGLTRFKVASEYVMIGMLGAALLWTAAGRQRLDSRAFVFLAGSMVLTMLSELCFTLYVSVRGPANLAGHLLKVLSFYLVYRALVKSMLVRPVDLLFRGIRESEERYHQVFETNRAVKLIIDPESGLILEANRAACEFYGYARETLLSMRITDINVLPGEEVHGEMARAASEERLYFNFTHRLASGELRDVQVYSGPVKIGARTLLYSIIHDVTEQRRAEKKLRESEERWRSLAESSPDHILLLDARLRIEFANAASPGLTVGDLLGKELVDYVEPERREEVRGILSGVLARGRPARYQTTYHPPGGRAITYESVVSPRRSGTKTVGLTLSARDITEQVRARQERARLEEELHQSRKMEAVGTLAGGVAHDFNNILGIILGNAELVMLEVPATCTAGKNLREIRTACLRGRDVVRQILRFSSPAPSRLRPLALGPVVREALGLLRASIPSSIEIRESLDGDRDAVLGDPTQIHQVVINLCTNAVHAMEGGAGVLEIRVDGSRRASAAEGEASPGCAPQSELVCLEVRDSGHGMDPAWSQRVFEPYFTTKEAGKGTGMGLAVVHRIVRQHGGAVTVESEPGRGSTFRVCFPRTSARAEEEPDAERDLPRGCERVLLVDDESLMLSMGRQVLERLGYRVEACEDPWEALKRFRADPGRYDLLITDMTMPGMTGDRLTLEVLGVRPEMPVVLYTGFSERMDAERAAEIGVRAFLLKPILTEVLARTVRSVLDGRSGPVP